MKPFGFVSSLHPTLTRCSNFAMLEEKCKELPHKMSSSALKLTKPEAMLFDLDGTLFKTETLLLPAYYATFERLREEGLYVGPTPPESIILGSLGMLLEHIWQRVMPDSPKETHRRADKLLLDLQLEGLREGGGELYDGV